MNVFQSYDPKVLGAAALAAALLAVVYLSSSRRGKRLPPGPPGLPIIGHTHLMAGKQFSWRIFHEWSKTYGEIMHLKLGGSDVIVINSVKAANALTEKKSAIYSDRPRLIVASEIISGGKRTVLMPYNDHWRNQRKFLRTLLHDKAAAMFEPLQEREAKMLIWGLLKTPEKFATHTQMYASNVILQLLVDRRIKSLQDAVAVALQEDLDSWAVSANAGAHIVDSFPILNHLPSFLKPWKAHGERLHKGEVELYSTLMNGVRERMKKGELPECFGRYLIENQKAYGFDDLDLLYMTGTMYEAGADTTASSILGLFLGLSLYPEVCAKAHAELDRVVGPNRAPTWEDMEDLPYIVAMTKEVGRWAPPVPAAVPHKLTQDDTYEGYFLPKGSTVIGNSWAIHRDPEVFPDPERFNPDRYLPENEGKTIDELLGPRGHFTFGYARRICPGYSVGERSLFITFANILHYFDIGPVPGLPPNKMEFSPGFVSHAMPFKVKITPRSKEKAEQVRREGENAWLHIEQAEEGKRA